MRKPRIGGLASAGLAIALAGCTVGPNYVRPAAPITPAFKEAQGWRPSQPADGIDRGAWWSMFDDPTLDSLEQRVAASNQTVKEFEAAYRQAHAIVAEARASFFPTLTGSLQATRSQGATGVGGIGGTGISTTSTGSGSNSIGQLDATWVPDLWGKVRRTVESDKALAQGSAAQLANAKLAAEATLAEDYFELRILDEEAKLFRATVADDEQFLALTQAQFRAGTQPLSAVVSAQTQLLNAKSLLIAVGSTRAAMEHAIAVLTGAPPAELSIPATTLSRRVPVAPAGVPSTLLERRPDIAAAERQVAAANAQIGVAISAYFPTVTLSASAGASGLLSSSAGLWSLGASAGETLLDFGFRRAQVSAARALYDEEVAFYRQTVLTAFQGVEDELAALKVYQEQQDVVVQAEAEARQAVQLDLAEYRAGTVDYTTVLTAQAAELTASQNVLTVLQLRLQASVLLVEDLGGGWSAADLPKS
jgi:NodT family efflux transporter outer membrane factor (OMF) lipoprotein